MGQNETKGIIIDKISSLRDILKPSEGSPETGAAQDKANVLLGWKTDNLEVDSKIQEGEYSVAKEVIHELTHKSKLNEHDDQLFEKCRDLCD